MVYFTLEFSAFLLVFLCLYWWVKKNYVIQNILLLIFNYFILIWISPYFAIVVGIYTIAIYLMSCLIYEYENKIMLVLCLSIVVLNLAFFKYFHEIKDSFDFIFSLIGIDIAQSDVLFPLGISFYTFASITYLCSVSNNKKLEDILSLATFLSFFPTFVSGPIMRSDFFFPQLHKKRYFGNINLIFVLILFGVTKKVFIANYLQIYSDSILQNPSSYDVMSLLLGIYAYSVRLYCDFSGYVDLVSAFALMIGFTLPQNFNMPYMASNIKDFWARWHITLSNFIRDYIYIPLGGNKKGFFLTQVFVLISFVLSGIWHGNTFNFFIWGLLHGVGVVFLNCLRALNIHINIPHINMILTFHFVAFAWIFFYYQTLDESLLYLYSFIDNISKPIDDFDIFVFILCCVAFFCYKFLVGIQRKCAFLMCKIPYFFQPFVISFLLIIVIGLSPSGIPNFIYASF